jgi:hypothetical protein
MNLITLALFLTAFSACFNTALDARHTPPETEQSLNFDIDAYLRTFSTIRNDLVVIDDESGEATLPIDQDFTLLGVMHGDDFIAQDLRISPEGQKRLGSTFQLLDIQNRPFQELSKADAVAIVCIMFRLSAKMALAFGKVIFDQCKKGAFAVAKRFDDDLRRGWENQRRIHPWMWDLNNA